VIALGVRRELPGDRNYASILGMVLICADPAAKAGFVSASSPFFISTVDSAA
jgi:hypothetical protein